MSRRSRRTAWLQWGAALLVLLVGIAVTTAVALQAQAIQRRDAIERAEDAATAIRDRLELDLQAARNAGNALDSYVVTEEGTQPRTEMLRLLDQLSRHDPTIKNISVARDDVVEYVQPLYGNSAVLGLDYRTLKDQYPAIARIKESGEPALVGPVKLVQGGRGLIYRIPVFVKGTYWGLISTVMDADALFRNAANAAGVDEGAVTVSARDAASAGTASALRGDPTTIWGSGESGAPDTVSVAADPLGRDWTISVVPSPVGAQYADTVLVVGYVASASLAVLVFALLGATARRAELSHRLRTLSAQVPGMLYQLRLDGNGHATIPYATEASRDMLGIDPKDLVRDGRVLFRRIDRADADAVTSALKESAATGAPVHQRLRIADAEGNPRWYLAQGVPEEQEDAVVWHALLTDVTDEAEAEEELRVSASVFASTRDGVVITDAAGRIVDVNPGFTALLGFGTGQVRGHTLDSIGAGLTPQAVYDDIRSSLDRHGFWRGELVSRTADGRVATHAVSVTAVTDDDGRRSHDVAVFSRLDTVREDFVTGLPSRLLLDDRLGQAVQSARAAGSSVAVMTVGIDRFRDVNEGLGHQVGDLVLREAGRRLEAAMPAGAVVARVGADEFAVVLPDAAAAEVAAATALHVFADPFTFGTREIHVTASVGVSVFPDDADDAARLLVNANQAMRVAKDQGRDRFRYFTASMQAEAAERTALADDLRRALDHRELRVEYQPIVSLADGSVRKAEALVRWDDPRRGPVGPAVFIPVAERIGLIRAIGDCVFAESIGVLARAREVRPDFEISVNMSPAEAGDDGQLLAARLDVLRSLSVPGANVVLEITEGVLLRRDGVIAENLRQMREAGLQFAVDDFGTGYSSLSYLQQLDVDYLKIDRSFVSSVAPGNESHALCVAIIDMAHALGLRVVAEGVETEAQRDLLRAASCDFAQGYLFSRSLPAPALLALLDGSADGSDRSTAEVWPKP